MNDSSSPSNVLRRRAFASRAWPFVEARAVLERYREGPPDKGYVLFETGYGPSGLPHIGTFGEVVRTTMLRRAFALLSDIPTRLFAFSDDMDALRKVPDNVPNQEMLRTHLGRPLTLIPDPFGTHASFGEHNNARLRGFLDQFGFEYEFVSATDCYRGGRFDAALLLALRHYDAITSIILPTLGPERRATYSPFLPISAQTGCVLQAPVVAHDPDAGTIVYLDEDGRRVETPVTGGRCKLQWKADWAMRWVALGVDYEMAGKDLIDSVRLSSRICAAMGGSPPQTSIYELFLDERGEKISKSRGNGLAVEDWLKYAPAESLALFMFQKPKTAKRLYFGVIPKTVDEYLEHLRRYPAQDAAAQLDNPVWHIHQGEPPREETDLSFTALLNLVGVCHSEDRAVLWHFVSRYWPQAAPETAPMVDRLIEHAIAYYRDFVKPALRHRRPTSEEAAALADLARELEAAEPGADAEALQTLVYEVGKRHPCFADLKSWFQALYQILLGQSEGPRMGSFMALYGVPETVALIRAAIAGENLRARRRPTGALARLSRASVAPERRERNFVRNEPRRRTRSSVMPTQGQQGRGSGKEQQGGGKSEQSGGQSEDDLKQREYRDKEGNIHHHTHTYMEQHKGEGQSGGGGSERQGGRSGEGHQSGKSEGSRSESSKSEGRPGGKSEGGKSEGGKSEGGKSEGGRSEGGRSEGKSEHGGSGKSGKQ